MGVCIGENFRKMAKNEDLKMQIYGSKLYYLIRHKILNITVHFVKHYFVYILRY